MPGKSDGFIRPCFEDGLSLRAVDLHSNVNALGSGDLSGLVEVGKGQAGLIDVPKEVFSVKSFCNIAKRGPESPIA